MLNRFARALFTRLLTPAARALLALGISPDVVTLVGTVGVCVGALGFYPRGEFFWGTVVVTLFVFADTVDGIMARAAGRSSRWGAFLDSTLDRIGDAAVFGGLVLYYGGSPGSGHGVMEALALSCLVLGSVVSYARARAEGLGMTASVGIAERADRLVAVLLTTGLVGLYWKTGYGLPEVVLLAVLALLALASLVTVVQRMFVVRRQAFADPPAEGGPAVHADATRSGTDA
jgi:CDP-diacylglycerol---glycerol-3-phosphate 3-phosphatidyltransferase